MNNQTEKQDLDKYKHHYYYKFCKELLNVSLSKNIKKAVFEWKFYDKDYPVNDVYCLCGRKKQLKEVFILMHKSQNKKITVGSECIKHFPDFDDNLNNSKFTNGYLKDGFVVDDVVEEEEHKETFEYESILSKQLGLYLIRWKNSITTNKQYEKYKKLYKYNIHSIYKISDNCIDIKWVDTWEHSSIIQENA